MNAPDDPRLNRRAALAVLVAATAAAPALAQTEVAPPFQLYASLKGREAASRAGGEVGGASVRTDSLVTWASAVKPTTCAALMKLVEAGRVSLDDPVVKFVPEFAAEGKADVLIWHLLTHSAHLGGYDGPMNPPPFDQVIAKIAAAPRELSRPGAAGGSPGGAAPAPGVLPAYNPAGIWILGEILQRLHAKPFWRLMRDEIYEPCGMVDSWNGMPRERLAAYGDRATPLRGGALAFRSGVGGGALPGRAGAFAGRAAAMRPRESDGPVTPSNPAGGGVGPCRDLARFYEMLLGGGQIGGRRILRAETVKAMTTLRLDDGKLWAWGLGLNLNVRPGGGGRGEARFGALASARAFGHAGASGITAFADPAHGLAIAAIPSTPRIDDLYRELKLA